MRILPINYNLYLPFLQKPNQKDLQSTPARVPLEKDTLQISFLGDCKSIMDEAINTSGIHCPSCGTRMLSKKNYEELVEKFAKVQTASEFISLMKEYHDYIPVGMKDIEKGSIQQSDEIGGFKEHIAKLEKRAFLKHVAKVARANEYILEFAKTQPESTQAKLVEAISSMHPAETVANYRTKLNDAIKDINFENKEAFFEFQRNTTISIKKSSDLYNVFSHINLETQSNEEISAHIAKKVFGRSISYKRRISDLIALDNPVNEVIICSNCNKASEKANTFILNSSLQNPELKQYIIKYLNDISMKTDGKDIHDISRYYVKFLTRFITKISKKEIIFTEDEIEEMMKISLIGSRHSAFLPIDQTKTDVPCAGCGSIMLPHDIKTDKIEKELLNCNSINGYCNILKKYSKYIGVYARPTADIFLQTAEEKNYKSSEEFLSIVQDKMDKYTDKEINSILKYGRNKIPLINRLNIPDSKKENYKEIIDKLNLYVKCGKLKGNYDYQKMVEEGLKGMNFEDSSYIIYTILNKLKIACYKNSISKCNDLDIEKDKDKNTLFTVMYKIFRSSVGTADHLVAKTKGGDKEKENMIGLCKSCNTIIKGKRSVLSWVMQNPIVKDNLPIHVKTIDEMYKRGELDSSYENWAVNIADKVNELTYGKLDFRKIPPEEQIET